MEIVSLFIQPIRSNHAIFLHISIEYSSDLTFSVGPIYCGVIPEILQKTNEMIRVAAFAATLIVIVLIKYQRRPPKPPPRLPELKPPPRLMELLPELLLRLLEDLPLCPKLPPKPLE